MLIDENLKACLVARCVSKKGCCCYPVPSERWGAWRKTERAAQRVRSYTVQNEIRDVLGRVSANAAERIHDSANPIEIAA